MQGGIGVPSLLSLKPLHCLWNFLTISGVKIAGARKPFLPSIIRWKWMWRWDRQRYHVQSLGDEFLLSIFFFPVAALSAALRTHCCNEVLDPLASSGTVCT
jgi:hypothetical protein